MLNCLKGTCSLHQKILDYGCGLQGRSCGLNMTFRIIGREELGDTEIIGVSCTVVCGCASEFYEKNGQCIPKERQLIPLQYNPVRYKIKTFW